MAWACVWLSVLLWVQMLHAPVLSQSVECGFDASVWSPEVNLGGQPVTLKWLWWRRISANTFDRIREFLGSAGYKDTLYYPSLPNFEQNANDYSCEGPSFFQIDDVTDTSNPNYKQTRAIYYGKDIPPASSTQRRYCVHQILLEDLTTGKKVIFDRRSEYPENQPLVWQPCIDDPATIFTIKLPYVTTGSIDFRGLLSSVSALITLPFAATFGGSHSITYSLGSVVDSSCSGITISNQEVVITGCPTIFPVTGDSTGATDLYLYPILSFDASTIGGDNSRGNFILFWGANQASQTFNKDKAVFYIARYLVDGSGQLKMTISLRMARKVPQEEDATPQYDMEIDSSGNLPSPRGRTTQEDYISLTITQQIVYVLGTVCTLATQCPTAENSLVCSTLTLRCVCATGFVTVGSVCLPLVSLGFPCQDIQQCTTTNAECSAATFGSQTTCRCRAGFTQQGTACVTDDGTIPLGQVCQRQEQCIPTNALCTGVCSCPPSTVQFPTGAQVCAAVQTVPLGQPCNGITLTCEQTLFQGCTAGLCSCITGYHASNTGFCIADSIPFGQGCEEDGQCSTATPMAVCRTATGTSVTTCLCPSDDWQYDGSACVPVSGTKLIGETCINADQCRHVNALCIAGLCACPDNTYVDFTYTPPGSNEPAYSCDKKKNPGDSCWVDAQCVGLPPNSVTSASCDSGVCTCDDTHVQDSNQCYPKVGLGESCERHAQCITNSQCTGVIRVCTCVAGYAPSAGQCISGPNTLKLDESCQNDGQCLTANAVCACPTNTACSSIQTKCTCKVPETVRYGPTGQDPADNLCLLVNVVPNGGSCVVDDQCALDNAVCSSSGTCGCPASSQVINNACRATGLALGAECVDDLQCGPDNSECSTTSERCSCEAGYTPSANGATCESLLDDPTVSLRIYFTVLGNFAEQIAGNIDGMAAAIISDLYLLSATSPRVDGTPTTAQLARISNIHMQKDGEDNNEDIILIGFDFSAGENPTAGRADQNFQNNIRSCSAQVIVNTTMMYSLLCQDDDFYGSFRTNPPAGLEEGQCDHSSFVSPCQNNGVCKSQSPVDYWCDCREGFTGVHCQTDTTGILGGTGGGDQDLWAIMLGIVVAAIVIEIIVGIFICVSWSKAEAPTPTPKTFADTV